MATTLTTEHSYTGNGSTTNYSVTFTYLKEADVKVTLDHVATTAYTFANASTISFTTAPANGVAIRIFRDTDVDAARFVFSSGSSLKAGELNENLDQLLYADQERASTDNIADEAVTTAKLRDGALTTAKIADGSITNVKIADGTILTAKLADNIISNAKMMNNSVNTAEIVNNAVTTAKIADGSITTAKIADSAITETKLADNSVTSAKIVNGTIAAVDLATNAVTASKIASNAVVEAKILNGAVTTDKVADSAITSGKIANDTIVNADVNASAAIAGTKVSPDFGSQTITTTGNITVSGTVDGRDVSTDGTKLDGIESGATADQTAAEVRTLVGSATDSNVFTDAEKTKLTGISAGADVTTTKSINDLTDVNTSGVSDGKILKYQASSSSFIIADDTGGSTGATTFTGLTDTPANYGSAAGKVLNINAAGNAVEFNSNLTINSSGRVAIGGTTVTDVNLLNIQGSGVASNIGLVLNDTNTSKIYGIQNGGSALKFYDYTVNTERVRISSDGKVGIGTSSPSARLDVRRGDADGLIAELHQSGGYGINIKSSQSVATIQAEANQALTFETGSSATERLRIDASGNTLVGKTASTGVNAGCEFRPAGMGLFTRASGNPLQVRRLTDDGDLIEFYQDTGLIGSIGVQGTSLTVGMAGPEKLRIDSSGRLLVGTTTANGNMTVNMGTDKNISFNGSQGEVGSVPALVATNNSGSSLASMGFRATDLRFATGSAERLRIDSLGRVGIGTTTIADTATALVIKNTASGNDHTLLDIVCNTNETARVRFSEDGSSFPGEVKYDTLNNSLAFNTNSAERLRIDSSGNVLLGTTTNYADGGADNLVIGNTSVSEQGITIGSSTSSQIRFADAGSNTAGYILYNHSDNALAFGVSSERMRIDSSGRLLVGTSSSRSNAVVASKLQIEGTGAESGLSIIRNSSGNSAYLQIGSTGGTSVGSTTASPGNTDFAQIVFSGSDGSAMKSGAYITAQVNQSGAWSSGDCPTALKFATTAAGASSPTERMRVDSDGRLLVGKSSSSKNARIVAEGNSDNAASSAEVYLQRGTATPPDGTDLATIHFADNTGAAGVAIRGQRDGGTWSGSSKPGRLVFSTTANGASSPTDWMKIDKAGTISCFSSSAPMIWGRNETSGSVTALAFYNAATSVTNFSGNVFRVMCDGDVENTNNNYGSISDIKLKENVVDAASQWDDIKALQVRNYNFKESTGLSTHTQIGLVAQEVETVSPGLVKDRFDLDSSGNDLETVTKSVNYSVLYMKAVKALQEAMTRIETLETKVAALEAG